MSYEQTIRSGVECRGIGLHSGAPVTLRILPAAAGTGVVFRRIDLDGFTIEASEIGKLKSVLGIAKEKRETPLPENEACDPQKLVKLGPKRAGNQVREGTF